MVEPEFRQAVPLVGGCFLLLLALAVAAVMAWVYCRIFSKAGYPWALGLLMLVPIANIIMPFVLAFGDWPIQKELRQLRQHQSESGS